MFDRCVVGPAGPGKERRSFGVQPRSRLRPCGAFVAARRRGEIVDIEHVVGVDGAKRQAAGARTPVPVGGAAGESGGRVADEIDRVFWISSERVRDQ